MKKEIRDISGFEKKVDALFKVEEKISELKGEADLLEKDIKETGAGQFTGFGSINLLGTEATAQVQRRRPSVSVTNGNIAVAEKLLGEKFNLFFDTATDGTEVLKSDMVPALKKLIVSAGKDPGEFFTLYREAKAKDTFLDEAVRTAILGAKKATKIFEDLLKVVSVKGNIDGVIALKWGVKK